MLRSQNSHRALRFGLALIATVLVSSACAVTASAKAPSCGDQVIADWYDDGTISKIYPLHCYRDAIANLPEDIVVYGNAKEEISRALALAKIGKPDTGGKQPPTSTTGTESTDTTTTKTATTGTSVTQTTPTTSTPTNATTSTTDTSGPSAVPMPLLVLGGLAILLLAAGSAGYLRRRMDSDGDGDGDGTPPAAA